MQKLPLLFFLIAVLFFSFPVNISAQVVINEFSSSDSSDWIEFYNTSVNEVDMTGWIVKDTATSSVYEFSNQKLPANGYCVQGVAKRLNNSGDMVQLLKGGSQEDCVSYGTGNGFFCSVSADVVAPIGGETASRNPEGIGAWVISSATQSLVACESLIPTPEPTLVPTSTPEPTQAPTAAPTPVSTLTPTLTPKKTVKPTKRPTRTSRPNNNQDNSFEEEVLGIRESLEPSASPESGESGKGKFSFVSILLIVLGIGFVGLASYPFIKDKPVILKLIKKYEKWKHKDF